MNTWVEQISHFKEGLRKLPNFFDVTRPAHHQWPFWASLCLPLIVATAVGATIAQELGLARGWGVEAFNTFRTAMNIPLWIATLSPALTALYLTVFRAHQTATQIRLQGTQIELQQVQNVTSNYYKHLEEFIKAVEKLPINTIHQISARKAHHQVYPLARVGDTSISQIWRASVKQRLGELKSLLSMKGNDVAHHILGDGDQCWQIAMAELRSVIGSQMEIQLIEVPADFDVAITGPVYRNCQELIIDTRRLYNFVHDFSLIDRDSEFESIALEVAEIAATFHRRWLQTQEKFSNLKILLSKSSLKTFVDPDTPGQFLKLFNSLDISEQALLDHWITEKREVVEGKARQISSKWL